MVIAASAFARQCLLRALDHNWSFDYSAIYPCSPERLGCFLYVGGDLCCQSSGLADLYSSQNSWWLECSSCSIEKWTTFDSLVTGSIAFRAHHSFFAGDTTIKAQHNFVAESWFSYGYSDCFEQPLYGLENSVSSYWRRAEISSPLTLSSHEYHNTEAITKPPNWHTEPCYFE